MDATNLRSPLPPVPAGLLTGKVAVVTGGASGLGAAIAATFVQAGVHVIIADIQHDKAQELAAKLGAEAITAVHCDVRKEDDLVRAIQTAVANYGGLDIMVNNAGIVGAVGPIIHMDAAEFDATLQVNLRGVFLGTKHAARVMKEKGTHGAIVNMSSVCGIRGGFGFLAYEAAKWGVRGLSEGAACELAAAHIRVNCNANDQRAHGWRPGRRHQQDVCRKLANWGSSAAGKHCQHGAVPGERHGARGHWPDSDSGQWTAAGYRRQAKPLVGPQHAHAQRGGQDGHQQGWRAVPGSARCQVPHLRCDHHSPILRSQ